MSSFSRESFISRLRGLTATQQAIQTLSLWCLHHRKHSNMVVSIWREEFLQCHPSRRIVLLYLANDIIQNSRKKGPEFRLSFQTVLKDAIRIASQTDSKTYSSVQRLLDIWEERGVFDEDYLRLLKSVNVEPHSISSATENNVTDTSTKQHSSSKIQSKKEKQALSKSLSQISNSTAASDNQAREAFTPLALRDLENEDEASTISLGQALESPPELEEVIDTLPAVTDNAASTDKEMRETIAKLSPEVSDYKDTSLDQRLKNKGNASTLIEKASSAANIVTKYTKRLNEEQMERRKLAVRLRACLVQQRNYLIRDLQLLEDSKARLQKVTTVRSELLKHLGNLPDLSQLPDLSHLAPLPAPRDLFR